MSKPKHPPEDYVELAQKKPFLTNKEIAAEFGVDESSVRRAFKKAKFEKGEPPEAKQSVETPLTVYGDSLWIADVHCPLHDRAYLAQAITRAVSMGIRQVIFCGDFWHCDQYGSYFPHQADIGLDVEIPTGTELMEWILSFFEFAIFIRGNHDYRHVKGRKFKISFVDAMKECFKGLSDEAKAKLTFTNLDHCYAMPSYGDGDGGWYVCHPTQYSRTPLNGARQLSTIVSMNVATAHSHHCARGYAPNGKHQAIELGGFFDRPRTAYLQSSAGFPKWTQGYAYYIDGKAKLESPAWT